MSETIPYTHLANVQQVFGTENCFTVDPVHRLNGYDFGEPENDRKLSTLVNQLFLHHANTLPRDGGNNISFKGIYEAHFLFRPGKYVRNPVILTFATQVSYGVKNITIPPKKSF